MAGSASTDHGYAVPRPDNLESQRTGLRTTIRPTPKVAQRAQSVPKNRSTGNMNSRMNNTKLTSAKSTTKTQSAMKTRKEKAKSRSAQKMKETPGTRPARFSPYAKTEESYLGGGFNTSKVQTHEIGKEPLGYPLEHRGGCQLPDVPSNTKYGKVCVCITNMLCSETEEEDASMSIDDVVQYASKASTRYNMKKQVQDFGYTPSSSSSLVLSTVKQPESDSEYIQAPITRSRYYDPNPEFESMFQPPPTPFPPITLPADFTLPIPPLLRHAASSWFIPGQIPPKVRDLDAIAIPTDLDSPRVCNEYYEDEFFLFIQTFKTLEADLIVRIHSWVLDLTQKANSNLSSHLRYLPTSHPQQWTSVRGTRKLMALRRMGEIIYAVLNEILEAAKDRKNEIYYREVKGATVEDDGMEGTWREYDVDETWEVAFRILEEVFVHKNTWEHTAEFCRLLMHEFSGPLRKYWAPIVVYYFGRRAASLADWTVVSD